MPTADFSGGGPAVVAGGGSGNAFAGGTPGAATGGATQVIDPGPDPVAALTGDLVFSPPSGTFQGQLDVVLSTDDPIAEIHYTLDGQPPSAASPLYTGAPIPISRTTELRAQSFVGGAPVGAAGTALYLARSMDVTSDLPLLVIDNYGAGPLDDQNRDFVPAAFMSFETGGGLAALSSAPAVAARSGVHIRGQSTATFPKPPVRVELWDNENEDVDWPLLGMPAESDWVLRGPYADKSLIRDPFIYDLGREMGLSAPRYAFCELYLNEDPTPVSADDYLGVYLVVETIKNAKNRLDLKQLREDDTALPDITGGYIFKFEWLIESDDPNIACNGSIGCWDFLKVHDPVPIIPEQSAWLSAHLQAFNDVLHSPSFADPNSGYAAYIDVDSFVDQLIINELSREMDSYLRSAYFYKDRDTKIYAGPLWDYNLVFGVGGFFENDQTAGWQHEQERQPHSNDWFQVLLTDPAFVSRVAVRWQQLRQGVLSNASIDARIATLTAPLTNAAARNFGRWPNLSDAQVEMFMTPTEGTWEGQVQYLRDWVTQRGAWLDTQWR